MSHTPKVIDVGQGVDAFFPEGPIMRVVTSYSQAGLCILLSKTADIGLDKSMSNSNTKELLLPGLLAGSL